MAAMLSPHFSVKEFETSPTAKAHGVANRMSQTELLAAKALCLHVLEPIRAHFGKPVTLNSGFRCDAVNRLVGSKPGSQHSRGEAADIEIVGVSNADLAFWILRSTIDFDQLILEAYRSGDPRSGWVHVSRNNRQDHQRRQALTMTMMSHGPVYSNGINP